MGAGPLTTGSGAIAEARRTAKRGQYLMRDPQAVVVSSGDELVLVKPTGESIAISRADGARANALLTRLATRQAITSIDEADHELVDLLVGKGIVLRGGRDLASQIARPRGKRVCQNMVLGVSGTVYATHVVNYVWPLRYEFCERLDVVLTESARRFVVPEAFTWLGARVFGDLFALYPHVQVPHIELAQQAHMVLILPASGHTLHKLASGACSDMLSLIVMATRAPVVIVPSMNAGLWTSLAVQRNVTQLRADGFYVIEPSIGYAVSAGEDAQPELGGPGLSVINVTNALAAVLAAHKSRGRQGKLTKRKN
jgi:hypothetical protein